jgi:hypothetical protein
MIANLGALTSLILQLMSMRKVLGPKMRPISTALGRWADHSLAKAKVITPLMKAGQSFMYSATGGLEFGMSYASMTALQKTIDKSKTQEPFYAEDIQDVMRSAELGTMIGGIAKYWSLQHHIPPPLTKVGEEVEQSIVAALQGVRGVYEQRGSLGGNDFLEAFLWEMTEVPAENLLPVIFGMSSMGDILGYRGHIEAATKDAFDAKSRLLRMRFPSLSEPRLDYYAKKGILKDAEAYAKQSNQKVEDLNYMDYKKVFDNLDKKSMKSETPEYVRDTQVGKKTWRNIKTTPTLRKMYLAYLARHKNVFTKQNIMDMYNDPTETTFDLEKLESVNDLDFATKQTLEAFKSMYEMEIKPATEEELDKLTALLVDAGTQRITLPDGAIMLGGLVDIVGAKGRVKTKGVTEVSKFMNIIAKWTEAQLGCELKPEDLFGYEAGAMIDEITNLEAVSSKATQSRIAGYVNKARSIDEYSDNLFDAIRGKPQQAIHDGLFEYFEGVRLGQNEYTHLKQEGIHDLISIMRKRLPRGLVSGIFKDTAFRIFTYSMFMGHTGKELSGTLKEKGYGRLASATGEKALSETLTEMRAYIPSDMTSPYWGNNTWTLKEGLRKSLGIEESLTIKAYMPFIFTIAESPNFTVFNRKIENINDTMREIKDRKWTLDEWIEQPYSGWAGIDLYMNRGLRARCMAVPLKRFAEAVEAKKIVDGKEYKLSDNSKMIWQDWIVRMRGEPTSNDKQVLNLIQNWVGKVPGVKMEQADARRLVNTIFSFIYAGGLGVKASAAVKNALQGPMNVPPGMTIYWWMRGLYSTWFNPAVREKAWEQGILRTIGVPVLNQDFDTHLTRLLQKSLFMFTAVDHYVNRVPTYEGARMQMSHYINRGLQLGKREGILWGVRKVGSKQDPHIKEHWLDIAMEAEGARRRGDYERMNTLVERIRDEYGFLQQANSNWEYGKLGTPSIWASTKGKVMGQFMTWPTWYLGTYIPSLIKQDFAGFARHIAKGILLIALFQKYFGMNSKPWILQGVLPMRPYGPIPQTLFNAVELIKAKQYGVEEWEQAALKDLKMSALVGIPCYYGVTDFMKLMRDMNREMPYTDDKTGLFYYGGKPLRAWSDYFGISNMYTARKEMLRLLKQGEYEAARGIGEKWGMRKINRQFDGVYIGED